MILGSSNINTPVPLLLLGTTLRSDLFFLQSSSERLSKSSYLWDCCLSFFLLLYWFSEGFLPNNLFHRNSFFRVPFWGSRTRTTSFNGWLILYSLYTTYIIIYLTMSQHLRCSYLYNNWLCNDYLCMQNVFLTCRLLSMNRFLEEE